MQLYKCLNCFLKPHNKQLNQYCFNFIIFLPKKKVLKNGSGSVELWVGSSLPVKNTSWVMGQPVFTSGQKIIFESGIFRVWSKNSNPFCHVYELVQCI